MDDEELDDEIDDSGEFWIQNGSVTYCNGDIGDTNHEVVAETAMVEELDPDNFFQMRETEYGRSLEDLIAEYSRCLESFRDLTRYREIYHMTEPEAEPLRGFIRDAFRHSPKHWIDDTSIFDFLKWFHLDTPEREAHYEHLVSGFSDVRTYALEHYGWRAVRGANVETWDLTQLDADEIAAGLCEAFDNAERGTFYVEVVKDRHTLDVTIEELENGAAVNSLRIQRLSAGSAQAIEARFDPQKGATSRRQQFNGVPGYRRPIYDNQRGAGPLRYDGTPVYRHEGD